MQSEREAIPVARPQLPAAAALLPYLQRIDRARTYANWGPLVEELEQRLSAHFCLPGPGVVSAGSGTAALIGAILAAAGRPRSGKPLALVPAYTFVASAVAVEQCGYRPYLVDVHPTTWALDPEQLLQRLDRAVLGQVGLVMPVAPYGRSPALEPWRAFRETTGIPVVIDAAAGFDTFPLRDPAIGALPLVLSFHATKAFATAEGGCVVTSAASIEPVTRALNFGFYGSRESLAPSSNGKMSEYHAAVGLAELDGWSAKLAGLSSVIAAYRAEFGRHGFGDRFFGAPDVSRAYALFLCRSGEEAARIQASLQRHRIDFRLWYGTGLHRHRQFADLPREPLPVTDELGPRLLGLPMSIDLSAAQVQRVAEAIAAA